MDSCTNAVGSSDHLHPGRFLVSLCCFRTLPAELVLEMEPAIGRPRIFYACISPDRPLPDYFEIYSVTDLSARLRLPRALLGVLLFRTRGESSRRANIYRGNTLRGLIYAR